MSGLVGREDFLEEGHFRRGTVGAKTWSLETCVRTLSDQVGEERPQREAAAASLGSVEWAPGGSSLGHLSSLLGL